MASFRSIGRTHRVPLALLGLLVGTLLMPRAFDEARVAVGAWLPATVAPERTPVAPLPQEELAKLLHRIDDLQRQLAARPSGDGSLPGLRYAPRRESAAPVAVSARVLHRETSNARRSIVVDAGRDDGVVEGLPVIQQDSLVGIVVTVSGRAARVLRVDDRSAVTSLPAVVLAADGGAESPCRGQGVARGTGDGLIRVSFLPSDGARVGDLVVTGAGSNVVPEGLLLGEVVSCGDEDRDGAFDAVVRPLRDLDAVASVLILRVEAPGLRVDAK